MFSPDTRKYSRRTMLACGLGASAAILLPDFIQPSKAEAFEKPYVIALHGYNGTIKAGFIGDLAAYLDSIGIPYDTPVLPGGMDPNRGDWEDIIVSRIKTAPQPPVLVAYSLSVIAALGALSRPGIEVGTLRTVAGRKIHPALPIDFPGNLKDFYGGGVNIEQIIQNTPGGRLVVHSKDDGVVKFEENALALAQQIQAEKYFVNGMGHFDQAVSKRIFEIPAKRIAIN